MTSSKTDSKADILESLSFHSEDELSCSCRLPSSGDLSLASEATRDVVPLHTLKNVIFNTWTVKSKQVSCPDLGHPHMVLFRSSWSHLPAYKKKKSQFRAVSGVTYFQKDESLVQLLKALWRCNVYLIY